MSSGSQRRACEFHLLRYVPDAVRNEYVHIGVILREQASPKQANPDAAKQLLPVRSDLASESVYLVSKNLTDFADVVRFVTRIKLVLPPKDCLLYTSRCV